MNSAPDKSAEFDTFAGDYDAALNEGISVSGEDKNYFARGRLIWTARCLRKCGLEPDRAMDFGCGTGSATPFFFEAIPGLGHLLGTDVSAASLDVARREHSSERVTFCVMDQFRPDASFDLVFCNGVFHHIPLAERPRALRYILDSLRPGGCFALWENNPWNPGTRIVMSRIPFDRDAITLPPPQCTRLVRNAGFDILRRDFLFYFPRMLAWFRPLERGLIKLPLGAQYLVLAQKPKALMNV